MRLFVSVDLPASLRDAIAALQEEFADASGLDFVDPASAHVTVKFLGEVDPGEYDALVAALERAVASADVEPFESTFAGLGVFPSLDYVSVLWVGVTAGADELARLHEATERETTALGYEPEAHSFTPHVTLARMKHAGGKDLVRRLVTERDPSVGTARVTELRLTLSTPTPEGSAYETVERFPLG